MGAAYDHLLAAGVLDVRPASTSTFTAPVESITGRRAVIGGIDTNADIALELFVLEPESEQAS